MRTCEVHLNRIWLTGLGAIVATATIFQPILAQDKPTGAPLVLSSIETEQEVPLAILLPDGKTAKCVSIRLHWTSQPDVGPNDDAASFTLDLPSDNPAAPIFTAQLWNASLASALAWQEPWEGARWKVLQTPVTDGTGLDAALAVGMIATSARRPYPPKTVVIGHLNPDGSLGPVSHLLERIDAAADAGMTRVIIPSVQRFETDATGQLVNTVRHASDLHLECIPVDDLVTATETTMNDPLPETASLDSSVPKYSNDVASYIDDFARREQNEAVAGIKYAPKEAELATYPPRQAAIWKSIYADYDAAQQAYGAGQVYAAYRLFCRTNGHMNGATALVGQNRASFDVKSALAESDDLHEQLRGLMNPPSIDQGGLESALLVAEMADWAYEINASLEGSSLVTKQAFSQRSDATEAEKDRAREAILFANEQCKYLLSQSDFYTGLIEHISKDNPSTVAENAAHLLPQLIPAQLATARSFVDGIRESDLRDGLLFDPRLVAYVNVLRQAKADWDAHQRRKDITAQGATDTQTSSAPATPSAGPVKLNANAPPSEVGFNPGDTYRPPHTVVAASADVKKISDPALCLIWGNNDCEIATLDEKYLRLNGTMDPVTHEWHLKDRGKLDALLQMADIGARHGIAFAEKADVDPSVLAMIYEKAAHERLQGDDASALEALRNYWRCALLGNVCWQLAHTPKAQPVEMVTLPPVPNTLKPGATAPAPNSNGSTNQASATPPSATTNSVVVVPPPGGTITNQVVTPVPPPPVANAPAAVNPPAPETNTVTTVSPTVAPIATNDMTTPTAPPADTNTAVNNNPPVAPLATNDTAIPVAPIAPMTPTVTDNPPVAPIATNDTAIPVAPVAPMTPTVSDNPPVAPIATNDTSIPVAPIATNATDQPAAPAPQETPIVTTNAPPAQETPIVTTNTATATTETAANDTNEMNIPVAPIAKVEDYTSGDNAPPTTNAAPVGPTPAAIKSDNSDQHSVP